MAINIDGDQHIRLKLGVFWVIIVTLVTAAVYTAFAVSQFSSDINTLSGRMDEYSRRTDALEMQLQNMRLNNADVTTKIAVIETKLSNIESNTRDIKDALRTR